MVVAVDHGLLLDGNPNVGRVVAKRFAEKSWWRDADDCEGMAFDDESRTYDGGIAAVSCLPCTMAYHGDWGSGGFVVFGSEDATAEGAYTERLEIISCHIFGFQRFCCRFSARAAHAQEPAAGLKRGGFFEFRRFGFEAFVERIGKHSPAVLRTTLDATVVTIAHAVEACWIADGQRAEHYGVDQREDGRGAADSQCQRENCRRRENGRQAELTECVAKIAEEILHCGLP